ncbi:unnamed protein product [Tetraodon nigroviridis]|uniref:(spotted green pufferfish) hypothetical protein n=1 Tax=Tetraodon nigroviridis TaxID=99883 RepID=Q4S2K6_TETNG|nr:unnamed protein product [Tetraodon nigroviridis]
MAAAESDRDSPSTLSAEFLNFSAKDTSAVSGSPNIPADQLLAVLSSLHNGESRRFKPLLAGLVFASSARLG